MLIKRKFTVTTGIAIMVFAGVAAIKPGDQPVQEFSNLKVLPKNISSKDLSKIMVDEFQDELGVSCNFCHAENQDTHRPDYASDEKPEKEIARSMMRMTIGINEKYFELTSPMIGDSTLAVTCVTCHHGQPHPDNNVP